MRHHSRGACKKAHGNVRSVMSSEVEEVKEAAALARQLRKRGISDPRVLDAIGATPRDAFVDSGQVDAAYCDTALPIGCGQTISQPFVVAYMTEKLEIGPGDDVLEIGTGSGYQAAILSRLCRNVYTIERHKPLLDQAVRRFEQFGLTNITAIAADGSQGWPESRQFDRIIVTAAAKKIPEALVGQLAEGGRMMLPLGGLLRDQRLVLLEKTKAGVDRRNLLPVRFVPLVSRPAKP
jgi:protein-L-isoaspartate(D-aspartate) O-methyltransferase